MLLTHLSWVARLIPLVQFISSGEKNLLVKKGKWKYYYLYALEIIKYRSLNIDTVFLELNLYFQGTDFKNRKQRNKIFTKNIIVFLLNNLNWTKEGKNKTLFCTSFLLVERKLFINKTKDSCWSSCFIVFLFF